MYTQAFLDVIEPGEQAGVHWFIGPGFPGGLNDLGSGQQQFRDHVPVDAAQALVFVHGT